MNQQLDGRPDTLPDSAQPATARLILQYLDQCPAGARIEAIAHGTGSKYRWAEATVWRLTHEGILHRVGPNCYAIQTAGAGQVADGGKTADGETAVRA
jgi:hypothetical protein